jgi:hypothetical protein
MSFGQGWNTTVQTSINEPNVEKMDLTANASGVHVLIKRSNGNIVYYNLNSSGVVDASKTAILQTSGDFPNIVASSNVVYALYKTGNVIRARYSTNGGSSWIWNSSLDRTTTANLCNGVDAVYEDGLAGGVHLVWATRDDHPNFKTYYSRLEDNQWVELQNVTSHASGFYGGFPTVSFSNNRVHISFNNGQESDPVYNQGIANTRDKIGSNWQAPQEVVNVANLERIYASGGKLFNFYTQFNPGVVVTLYVKSKDITAGYWPTSSELLKYSIKPGSRVSAIESTDGKLHIVYPSSELFYRNYDGSGWIDEESLDNNYIFTSNISSVSNDLYITWKRESGSYIMYRQFDAAPLAPQNPQLSTNPSNNRVRLSWSKNQEPDISIYEVWRKVAEMGGNWQLIGTTTNNYFVDNEYYYAPKAGDFTLTYRVRAKDIGNNFSLYSNEVTVRAEYLGKEYLAGNNTEYKLIQNYPNPFNPSTKISYSIKEVGFVTLKVYDILGVEIATLVNEQKTAGIYEADFNAANLPSGMYVYKLQSGSFTDVKKMLLTK